MPFDRLGLDPFTQPFPITLRLEGTVRGTGGLQLQGLDGATRVPGLYAAGDVASREPICGGFTGGGSHNAAWALSTGFWSGAGAADHALAHRSTPAAAPVWRAGQVGLAACSHIRTTATERIDPQALVAAVQAEVFPLERNWFRSRDGLEPSLQRLDALWAQAERSASALPEALRRTRQAVALLAHARWMYRSALARTETRGMHRRTDFAQLDPAQQHHVVVGGLQQVWTGRHPASEGAAAQREAVAA